MKAPRKPRKSRPSANGQSPTVPADLPTSEATAALEYVRGSDLDEGQERVWLWESHVFFGALTMLEGAKGSGKSTLLATIAADVTGGPRMTPGRAPRVPRHVVWYSGEEHPVHDTQPKIRAAGGNARLVLFPGRDKWGAVTRRLALPAEVGLLTDFVRAFRAGLVILDPWSSCLSIGASTADPVNTRHTMESLAALAHATDAAVIVTRNFRKDQHGGALASGLGSIEASNVARAVIQLRPHPDHHRRYVCVVAAANGFQQPEPFGFRLEPFETSVRLIPEEPLDITADQLAEGDVTSLGRDERRDCLAILAKCLAGQWVPCKDLLEEARRAGVCERTLRSVKAEHRIPSRRRDDAGHVHYEWGPPAKDYPPLRS